MRRTTRWPDIICNFETVRFIASRNTIAHPHSKYYLT